MVEIKLDGRDLLQFRRSWDANAHNALATAFKAEAFRLKKVVEGKFAAGLGPPAADLSVAQQKAKTRRALSAFSRFIGYRVMADGPDVKAEIGLGFAVTRARRNPDARRRTFVTLLEGGGHPISRADQKRIAGKIRRRLARTALGSYGPRIRGGQRTAKSYAKTLDIGFMLPRVGTVLRWPQRDFVQQVVLEQAPYTRRNVERLMALKMSGRRWAREWWRAPKINTGMAWLQDAGGPE